MIKRYSILISLLLTLFCGRECFAQSYEFAQFEFYAEANEQLGKPQANENRVVLMGDSITQFWTEKRPQFFTSNNLIGRGISAQTSYQMLIRFHEDVIRLQPYIVVINCGTNDIAENAGPYVEDYSVNNVMAMTEIAQCSGAKVILTSVLPHHYFFWRTSITGIMPKVVALNERIKAYADANNIPYIDYFSAMVSDDGSRMREDLAEDGVHPNDKGYEIMESLLMPAINELR